MEQRPILYFEMIRGLSVMLLASPRGNISARPVMPASHTRNSRARFYGFSPTLMQTTAHHYGDIDAMNRTQQTASEGNTIHALRTNFKSST